jgi:carbon-monoxide dehydrogenase medium subunit
VKPPAFDYARPRTLDEALALVAAHGGDATPLAGGQSLMPALNLRLAAPALLVDLNEVPELRAARVDSDGTLVAGALARHRWFETHPAVARGWPLLAHAMGFVAHLAIRNRGTVGGSLCHADPSAEWPALALACDAQVELHGPRGTRRVAAADFSQGLFSTARAADELLVRVRFPAAPAARRWGFREVARRRGDFAIAGVACRYDLAPDGRMHDPRVVLFGVGDAPLRAAAAEAVLRHARADAATRREAARAARAAVECRADPQASAAYRSELVGTLVERALDDAATRPVRAP